MTWLGNGSRDWLWETLESMSMASIVNPRAMGELRGLFEQQEEDRSDLGTRKIFLGLV